MDISVVIPVLNEAELIGSMLARTWEAGPAEILVVDGGSEDATPQIAEKAGCRVLFCDRPSRGLQQRVGAEQAKGEVVLFLHADTWLAPGGLEQIRTAMSDPHVLAGAFRQRIEAHGVLFRLLERGNVLRVRIRGMAYGDQGIFLRRKTLERLGGYPDLPLMEDVALMRKLRRQARPVLLAGPLHVSARRWLRAGVFRQSLRNWSLLARYRLGVSPERLAQIYYSRR